MDALTGPVLGDGAPDPTHASAPEVDPATTSKQSRRHAKGRAPLPTREEILRRIEALPRLIMLGVLLPSAANAINQSLQALLKAMAPASPGATKAASAPQNAARWREVLLQFPEVGEDLAQFMDPDAIEELFNVDPSDTEDT